MRYIVDANNYIKAISFGCEIECQDDVCTEYTGSVPKGYASLEDWYAQEVEMLYRWQVVSGNLTLNSNAKAPREGTGTYNDDYDNAPLGTWWSQPAGGACSNTPPNVTYGYLTTEMAGGTLSQIYRQYATGETWFRSNASGDWKAWARIDGLANAPGGLISKTYSGVSTNAKLEEALTTTWAEMDAGTLRYIRITVSESNLALSKNTWVVQLYKHSNTYGFAEARCYGSAVPTLAHNTFYGGAWVGWGFVNPQMAAGVEYRTTERWLSGPVYVKALNVGYVSAGSNAIAHGCAMKQPLTVEAYNNNVELVTGYSGITSLTCDGTNVHMTCSNDFGNITFYLKYTK